MPGSLTSLLCLWRGHAHYPDASLPALQIVSRTGKLAYEWRGLKHLPELLDRLVADQV